MSFNNLQTSFEKCIIRDLDEVQTQQQIIPNTIYSQCPHCHGIQGLESANPYVCGYCQKNVEKVQQLYIIKCTACPCHISYMKKGLTVIMCNNCKTINKI